MRELEWNPSESFKLEIREGTLPFDDASGSFSVVEDGVGTIATFEIEYDLKALVPLDAEEMYRQNREKLLPLNIGRPEALCRERRAYADA